MDSNRSSKSPTSLASCTPGIGGVELGFQQSRGKTLGCLGMAAQQTFGIASLTPYVRPTTAPFVDDTGIKQCDTLSPSISAITDFSPV
jgi:hypothetical protein